MEDLLLDLELFMQCDDTEVCPPPVFDLPPPPPPPWMDVPADCGRGGCGDAPHVSSLNHVQEIFHSISIIIVCSLIIVITIMLAALLIWRRRQILLRKFGSSPQLPSESESSPSSKENKTLRPDFGHRTLPNHYISDHQLVTDMAGRTLVTSSPNTLIIGGVPFHIRQNSSPGGVARLAAPPPPPPPGGQQVERSVIYPVYETIESDYSEMSSVYSDRDTSGSTMYTQCTSGSSAAVYTDMSSGINYILANQTIIRPNQPAYQQPEVGHQPRLVDGSSVLQFVQQAPPPPEVSGYPPHQDEKSSPRFQPSRPLLRNLPAAAGRSQSLRTRAPLPPVPRVQLLQSTISLENNPTTTPVSNL